MHNDTKRKFERRWVYLDTTERELRPVCHTMIGISLFLREEDQDGGDTKPSETKLGGHRHPKTLHITSLTWLDYPQSPTQVGRPTWLDALTLPARGSALQASCSRLLFTIYTHAPGVSLALLPNSPQWPTDRPSEHWSSFARLCSVGRSSVFNIFLNSEHASISTSLCLSMFDMVFFFHLLQSMSGDGRTDGYRRDICALRRFCASLL